MCYKLFVYPRTNFIVNCSNYNIEIIVDCYNFQNYITISMHFLKFFIRAHKNPQTNHQQKNSLTTIIGNEAYEILKERSISIVKLPIFSVDTLPREKIEISWSEASEDGNVVRKIRDTIQRQHVLVLRQLLVAEVIEESSCEIAVTDSRKCFDLISLERQSRAIPRFILAPTYHD